MCIRDSIKIVIALGSHRYMTEEEMRERVGDTIYDTYPVMNSEFRDPEHLVYIGDTEEGAPLMATSAIMDEMCIRDRDKGPSGCLDILGKWESV